MLPKPILLACLLSASAVLGNTSNERPFSEWAANQLQHSLSAIEAACKAPGAVPGVVIASPSRKNPDYFYHWVRDASLTMHLVATLYQKTGRAENKALLRQFAQFSRANQQNTHAITGLGEPKFHVDGNAFTGSWGRPQNDGPAIRAFTLVKFAEQLLKENQDISWLYQPELPAHTVIKADLEYVAHHWHEPSFDIWEEELGDHFYTRLVQWRAMVDGARLARRLKDDRAAAFYMKQARAIRASLETFWDADKKQIVVTRNHKSGLDYKHSGTDIQVLLAVLHGGMDNDPAYGVASERVLATAVRVVDAFKNLYVVNTKYPQFATAIGRYPEDQYNGNGFGKGNPWFLATAGMAELYYRAGSVFAVRGTISVTNVNVEFFNRLPLDIKFKASEQIIRNDPRFGQILSAMKRQGDAYLKRVKFHASDNYNLREQYHHDTGYQTGATELTWSHASMVTAWHAREFNIQKIRIALAA